MSFTQDQLTKLEAAIASGALEVRYADKTVKYHAMADMLKARDLMRLELGITSSSSGRKYASTSKGFK